MIDNEEVDDHNGLLHPDGMPDDKDGDRGEGSHGHADGAEAYARLDLQARQRDCE